MPSEAGSDLRAAGPLEPWEGLWEDAPDNSPLSSLSLCEGVGGRGQSWGPEFTRPCERWLSGGVPGARESPGLWDELGGPGELPGGGKAGLGIKQVPSERI